MVRGGGRKNQFLGSFIGTGSCRWTDRGGKEWNRELDRAENDERNFSKMRCTFDRLAKGLRETYFPSRWINWNFHFNITTAMVRGGRCACMRVR